jgi:uncharacterized SAM-binding protein YcdF (DUF218 family)
MFFILSKVLFFLLVPFWWILLLLVLARFSKRQVIRKRLWMICIAILVVFTNPFLYRKMVQMWQPDPVDLPSGKTYDAGILLGGMSGSDKNNRGYFGDNADRFIQTANLYHRGIIKKIIVSGGTGSLIQKEPPEASYLRQQLIDNGVNPAAIYMDNRSRNTYENAVFSKTITDSLHLQPPFVLITSAIHMKRSKSVFTKAGVQFIAYPCDYKVYPLDYTFENTIVPRIELLNDWSYFIKEMVGLAVYKLTGKA